MLRQVQPAAEKATTHFPDTWAAALALAKMRNDADDPEAGLTILKDARQRFPEIWPLVDAEAELLEKTRGAATAIPEVKRYAEKHWWHMDSHIALGRLLAADEQFESAIDAMKQASRLDIYDPKPLANIARIELRRNRLGAALEAQRAAIRRDGTQPSRYQMLAGILTSLGRKEEAALALHKAAELRESLASR